MIQEETRSRVPAPRLVAAAALLSLAFAAGCKRDAEAPAEGPADVAADAAAARDGSVTISGDDRLAGSLTWRRPEVEIEADDLAQARRRADAALAEGRLHEDAEAAIPLYLAVLEQAEDDAEARAGLQRALSQVLAEGRDALAQSDDDVEALRRAHVAAAVARNVDPDDEAVQAYLAEVDVADRLWELNRGAEQDLRAGRYGESGGGALAKLREALELRPQQPRAMQTLAAVESGLIRRAEASAAEDAFDAARRWLAHAATVRPGSETVEDAEARIDALRRGRIAQLRDEGLAALPRRNGIDSARERLAEMLAIAEPGDPAVVELRERIDLAVHYGLFRPGQVFTDALGSGARGPQVIVVPHGAFAMGARDGDEEAAASEKPRRNVRFDRGFALSVHEVTVGEFGRFIAATGYETRAERRGYSMAYDERSGNFIRRSGVDWRSDYAGARAGEDAPVLHVSARDAQAYADWLARESGQRYRLPSEAEFEYALRAGREGRYPWGDQGPAARAGNFTGALDRSPGGRSWSNAFPGYGDGSWGPAPVGRYAANPWGVHDLAGNVSEWVADCWHDSYRRAPEGGSAWVNPGCRTQVIRGGSWASSPAQTRASWRAPAQVDTTNARIGFRVVREI
jgi:formylglycine-generating enzyme required for sulfatase activity